LVNDGDRRPSEPQAPGVVRRRAAHSPRAPAVPPALEGQCERGSSPVRNVSPGFQSGVELTGAFRPVREAELVAVCHRPGRRRQEGSCRLRIVGRKRQSASGSSGTGSGVGSVPSSGGGVGGVPSSGGGVGRVPSSGGGDGSGTSPGSSIPAILRSYPALFLLNRRRAGRQCCLFAELPGDSTATTLAAVLRLPNRCSPSRGGLPRGLH
jgi:hypothetical protein